MIMNEHVIKPMMWLDDNKSVTKKKLRLNAVAAYSDPSFAVADAVADAAAYIDAYVDAADDASIYDCVADDIANAESLLKEYFELTREDKQLYIDEIQKRKVKVKSVYTQAMKDNGIKIKEGMMFTTETNANYTAELVNDKSVCFTDEYGFFISLGIHSVKPADTRTDEEKAEADMIAQLENEGIMTYDPIMLKILISKFKVGKVRGVTFTEGK